MKRTIKAILLTLVSIVILTGCSGEGDLKIKVVSKDKVIENLDIYVDDKKMGTSQAGFVSYKVTDGDHIVKLVSSNKDAKYTKTYTKKVMIADKSIVEVIVDIKKVEPIYTFNKSRIDEVAKLFTKYDLSGAWMQNGNRSMIYISKNGEWKEVVFNRWNNYKNAKPINKITFDPNTYIFDNDKGLNLSDTKVDNIFKYPNIQNNCFRLTGISKRNSDGIKFCKNYSLGYVRDTISDSNSDGTYTCQIDDDKKEILLLKIDGDTWDAGADGTWFKEQSKKEAIEMNFITKKYSNLELILGVVAKDEKGITKNQDFAFLKYNKEQDNILLKSYAGKLINVTCKK